ncbi:MAG: hypothetical protein ACE3JK_10190 [Sporolactobacillus sp.]
MAEIWVSVDGSFGMSPSLGLEKVITIKIWSHAGLLFLITELTKPIR